MYGHRLDFLTKLQIEASSEFPFATALSEVTTVDSIRFHKMFPFVKNQGVGISVQGTHLVFYYQGLHKNHY